MHRFTLLLSVIALILAAPAAAQDPANPGSPFGPLPPPAPVETPTPEPPPSIEAQQETDRTLMFAIGGGLLVLFVVIGRVITRDARRALHERGRDERTQPRDQGPHKHARQTKAKARAKTKAQRRARRQNR
jgi:hypothetical protein